MILPLYLAMTAGEFANCKSLPDKVAWMGCHFSSRDLGLSNMPQWLPEGSLLMVDDWMPIGGHDPHLIGRQLQETVVKFHCKGIILDFQRPGSEETMALCRYLSEAIPCPVAVSHWYAEGLDCPVFLSALPLRKRLAEHLSPWLGRPIWMEATLDAEEAVVTEDGCQILPGCLDPLPAPWHKDESLYCRYHWEKKDQAAQFLVQRQKEDLTAMLDSATGQDLELAVGLYQQLK